METTITPLLEGRERFLVFLRSRISDPDMAEDLLQESLLKALRAAPGLKDQDRLIPWFFTILRNAITDAYRKQGRQPAHTDLDFAANVEEELEVVRTVCACMGVLLPSLKPEYGEVIAALDFRLDSAEKLRDRLGVSATNLKVRHHRARQALRKKLEETCRVCAEHHCLDCTCERASDAEL